MTMTPSVLIPIAPGTNRNQELADAFLVATLITNGIFWVLLGGLTGFVYQKLASSPQPQENAL